MSSRNFAVVETSEGCLSRVIATPDFVVRVWVEDFDPEMCGGWAVALSVAGDAGLHGLLEAGFRWRGTRAELARIVRTCPRHLADDPRFEVVDERAGVDAARAALSVGPSRSGRAH